ncbi:hypothetical protein [Flavobacterium rhizosphaerae]|uniref:PKD domain-containing protein n=1 Tax=Flavobacterium rhizosphaerae TaxID=3163298 RepID=A0ABW8YXR2_9FLAO
MINNIKKIPPRITFGSGLTTYEIPAGTPVTVWQQTLYNSKVYFCNLSVTGATVKKISNYEFIVTYNTPGNYQLSLSVISSNKTISLESNILNLTVV